MHYPTNEKSMKNKTSKEVYDECMIGEDESKIPPIERLRFFCSIAMSNEDWLETESFFHAIENQVDVRTIKTLVDGVYKVGYDDAKKGRDYDPRNTPEWENMVNMVMNPYMENQVMKNKSSPCMSANHEWVSMKNEHVISGLMCLLCGKLKEEKEDE